MQKDEGMALVAAAICSGIFNDLGSGSNVDLCIITKVILTLFMMLSDMISYRLLTCMVHYMIGESGIFEELSAAKSSELC
jgi:hypothetical protein